MHSRPRHARKNDSRRTARLFARAGLMAGAAGAVVGAAGGTAAAAPGPLPSTVHTTALDKPAGDPAAGPASGVTGVTRTVKNLQPDPLANTHVDPVDNSVGTSVADFKPVSTAMVTGPLARGKKIGELPVVGRAMDVLPG